MRKVRFWAIAPVAILAAISGKPLLASPVFQATQAASAVTELPQKPSLALSVVHSTLTQATPSPSPSPSSSPLPSVSPSPSSSPSPTSSGVLLDQQGELSPSTSSVLNSDGSLYNQHTFDGVQGQVVNILLDSADFDTYLAIFDTNGKLLGENDDAGETCNYQDERAKKDFIGKGLCNSRLNVTLPATGSYKVIVNGHDRTDRGKYHLKIQTTSNQ
ncbi:MAG: peptidase [Actinomycetota bacterium]